MNQTKLTSILCLVIFIGSLLLLLCACTINPVVYTDAKGRDVAWLGGSAITKSKDHMASITRPDGTVITTRTVGKDETAVPRYAIQAQAAEAIAGIAGSVTKNAANNETARVISGDGVKTTAITAPLAAQTEQARIAAEAANQ
jgi:hypothetical protein